jgi:hypothetical protein
VGIVPNHTSHCRRRRRARPAVDTRDVSDVSARENRPSDHRRENAVCAGPVIGQTVAGVVFVRKPFFLEFAVEPTWEVFLVLFFDP